MVKEGEVGVGSGFCDLWIVFFFVLGSLLFIFNGKLDYL